MEKEFQKRFFLQRTGELRWSSTAEDYSFPMEKISPRILKGQSTEKVGVVRVWDAWDGSLGSNYKSSYWFLNFF
jgi:hypothetical protein